MMYLLRVDRHDGNDPIEADVSFDIVPQKGMVIELWDKDSGFVNSRSDGTCYHSGESIFAEVEQIVLCAYAPDRVEVWVRFDGFDLEQVERVMAVAQRGDTP